MFSFSCHSCHLSLYPVTFLIFKPCLYVSTVRVSCTVQLYLLYLLVPLHSYIFFIYNYFYLPTYLLYKNRAGSIVGSTYISYLHNHSRRGGGAAQTKNLILGEDTKFWLLYNKRGKKRRRRSSNKDTLKKVELLRKYYRDNFVYSFFRNETLC